MDRSIYLVMEFDDKIIYIPFKSLKDIDEYTTGFDNQLELVAATKDIIGLDIPNEEILDAYLSEDIDKIDDDMQEFNNRYLSIKYQKDDYDKSDLEKTFIKYVSNNINDAFKEFNGLKNIYDNYISKYLTNRNIADRDTMKIALLYLGDNHKRYKECYFILKNKKIKIKTKEKNIVYNEENIKKMHEEDKMLLVQGTNMTIDELNEYINRQTKGKRR